MQIARQAAELRASRQRIVAAQDEERRRLERNIHDGAQQHLVALAVKLRLAEGRARRRTPSTADGCSESSAGEVDAALDTLRSLALGIYPPLLEEQGIAAALAAQYLRSGSARCGWRPTGSAGTRSRSRPPSTSARSRRSRTPPSTRMRRRSRSRSASANGALEFAVADDGVGFDLGRDRQRHGARRACATGWRCSAATPRSSRRPGEGTIVRGRVPAAERGAGDEAGRRDRRPDRCSVAR